MKRIIVLTALITFSLGCSSTPKKNNVILISQINNEIQKRPSSAGNNNFKHNIYIELYPNKEIVGQGMQTVSFGLPLPPGVLLDAKNVVVLDENNQEVPSHVRSLVPWNHMPPQSLLCDGYTRSGTPGIRSVLIQFENEFVSNEKQKFSIRLNEVRQFNIAKEADVQSTLRTVNDGTYQNHNLGFQIYEPKILTVIDPYYLSCTNLTTLSGEIDTNVDMVTIDKAQQDYFYTAINEFFDWSVSSRYKFNIVGNIAAYWLYDRPQTFFNAYIRSGNVDQLREGIRAVEDYKNRVYTEDDCSNVASISPCVGYFDKKNTNINSSWKDSKYSYNENFVTAYLLTGNDTYLQFIPLAAEAVKEVNFNGTVHTERHRANALLTTVMHYELTNDQTSLSYITNAIDNLYNRQQIAKSGSTVNGCFNYLTVGGSVVGFSPWMSSLLANAILRTYQVLDDERIPGMLVDLAQCIVDRALFRTDVFNRDGYPNLLLPYYRAQSYGEKRDINGFNPWASHEHALDVALPVALGAYFATDINQQNELLFATRDLLKSADFNIGYWTRKTSGRPVHRLTPPRKYNWQFKNVGVISWILNKLDNSNSLLRLPLPPQSLPQQPEDKPVVQLIVQPQPNEQINNKKVLKFIDDYQFNKGSAGFVLSGSGEVNQTRNNPLSGANSLYVKMDYWGNKTSFRKRFGRNSGTKGEVLEVRTLVKVVSASPSAHLSICVVVFYQNGTLAESCKKIKGDSTTVTSVNLNLELVKNEQIRTILFRSRLHGYGPFEFLLDDAHLNLYSSAEVVDPVIEPQVNTINSFVR